MPVISGGVIAAVGEVLSEEISITQAANNTGGTYTGSITIPANSWIIDIRVYASAVWNSATSATLKVGDASVADGWYTGVRLHTTDLLAGECLTFDSSGGVPGAYLVVATGLRNTMWSASERVISVVVTEVTTTVVPTGVTRMLVLYTSTSNAGAAVFA